MRRLFLRTSMAVARQRYWRPVERLARRPDAAQRDVLQRLIAANRETRFGREHDFAAIADAAQFRERVPVQEYEQLRPYVEEQRRTGAPSLTAEPPRFYAQTSGTTGRPKYIPITSSMLAMHRSEQALFSYLQYRARPDAFEGRSLGIMGAAVEGHLDSGHAIGSVSGHLYRSLPRVVQARFVVPPEVSAIADYDLKYFVIVCLALAAPDITYMGSPNPSTFLRLLDVMHDERERLVHCLQTGTIDRVNALDDGVRREVSRRFRADPAGAARLRSLRELTFATVWPRLRLVTTWTGGSCGIALGRLRRTLPPDTSIMELGYQSSECRGTLALETDTAGGLPPLHHHFFEFVEPDSWQHGTPAFLTLDQLELGRTYYVIVTTASGLYRYFMNDLVEVTGFFHRTPLLRFVQKGRGVTSLTGEKLYEAQAIDAIQDVASRQGLAPGFFLLVADEEAAAYRVFIDGGNGNLPDTKTLAAAIDERLGELNVEYQGKRRSGRLGPLSLRWLSQGAFEAYKAACVRNGQREGQFKPTVLQYARDLVLSLDEHVRS